MIDDVPKAGDEVVVRFSHAVNSGRRSVGVVNRATVDEIVINKRVYRWTEIKEIEVIND